MSRQPASVLWFETLSRGDVALVGGRNSSLGEMVPQLGRKGVQVSCGFAASADACRAFLAANALPSRIADRLQRWRNQKLTLHKAGIQRRAMILAGDRPKDIKADIRKAYRALSQRAKTTDLSFAVRSSATVDHPPDAERFRPLHGSLFYRRPGLGSVR